MTAALFGWGGGWGGGGGVTKSVCGLLHVTGGVGWGGLVSWFQRREGATLALRKMERSDRVTGLYQTLCEIDAAACPRSFNPEFLTSDLLGQKNKK